MNVCEVPDVCKNMEYKLVTEDSKTRVYLSLVCENSIRQSMRNTIVPKRKQK